MKSKLDNYMKIKKLLFIAKQTFLNEKGQEIIPTLESLEIFNKELGIINTLVINLVHKLKGTDEVEYFGGPIT